MERPADGRGRRYRVRGSERAFSKARLGKGAQGAAPWRDTVRLGQRLGEIHRLRQTVSPIQFVP